MSKVDLLFEYLHFRIYRFFDSKGDSMSRFSATAVLTMMQCIALLDVVVVLKLFYHFPLPDKIFFLIVIVIAGVLNWYRYDRNFDLSKLEKDWSGENEKKRIKNGWLIGLYLVIMFLIPILHGYLEHNLKII